MSTQSSGIPEWWYQEESRKFQTPGRLLPGDYPQLSMKSNVQLSPHHPDGGGKARFGTPSTHATA